MLHIYPACAIFTSIRRTTIRRAFFKKGLNHIWILVYIGTHNVDVEPFGKPPDLHHHIIMDLDLFGIHMHKHIIIGIALITSSMGISAQEPYYRGLA